MPALELAGEAVAGASGPAGIEMMLRQAVERLGGGELGEASGYLFGLMPGTRGRLPTELRRLAADQYEMKPENFRKSREPVVIAQVAEQVLVLFHEVDLREAHTQMKCREPVESRLAVQWVERFEAYYRVWTPILALGQDLVAYRATMLEFDRPYDSIDEPGPRTEWKSLGAGQYTQEYQAEGYIRFALFHYASFLFELHQFMIRHGGLWLLSAGETDTDVADAIYRIKWHTPNNERDDSWLRGVIRDARNAELHPFLHILSRTTIGTATHAE